jgi:hypothetical protein
MSKRVRRSVRSKSKNRRNRRNITRKQRGGKLPIPRGAIAVMSLDPKNLYSVPLPVSKEMAEEILDM